MITYKVHLDGYNQMDLITGKGLSNRHEIFYFGESSLAPCASTTTSIVSSTSPAAGSASRPCRRAVPDQPSPRSFERTAGPKRKQAGAQQYFDWFKYEFWRFVFVQQQVVKLP